MERSDDIKELAAALAQAQGQIVGATKYTANTYFKSKYADLASVWEACRVPLSKAGLAVAQFPTVLGVTVSVETLLLHISGQWMRSTLSANAKDNGPQAIGSTITYLRRYSLQSIIGIAPEDDDAEAGEGRAKEKASSVVPEPAGYRDWFDDMTAVVSEGTEALQAAWKTSKVEYRSYLTSTAKDTWETLKTKAAQQTTVLTSEL